MSELFVARLFRQSVRTRPGRTPNASRKRHSGRTGTRRPTSGFASSIMWLTQGPTVDHPRPGTPETPQGDEKESVFLFTYSRIRKGFRTGSIRLSGGVRRVAEGQAAVVHGLARHAA